jgi:hypothetical protein
MEAESMSLSDVSHEVIAPTQMYQELGVKLPLLHCDNQAALTTSIASNSVLYQCSKHSIGIRYHFKYNGYITSPPA